MGKEERKQFFFEKKNQKTFILLGEGWLPGAFLPGCCGENT
jgi:hypothetical protein